MRYYVGAANLDDDGGYAGKVLAEHERLRLVAGGAKSVPTTSSSPTVVRPQPARPPASALPVASVSPASGAAVGADAGVALDAAKVVALAGY